MFKCCFFVAIFTLFSLHTTKAYYDHAVGEVDKGVQVIRHSGQYAQDPWLQPSQRSQPAPVTSADIDTLLNPRTLQTQEVATAEQQFVTQTQQWLQVERTFEPAALQHLIRIGHVLAERTTPELDLKVDFFDQLLILRAQQEAPLHFYYNPVNHDLHGCYRIVINQCQQAQDTQLGFRFSWAMFQHKNWAFSERDYIDYVRLLASGDSPTAAREFFQNIPDHLRLSRRVQEEIARLTPPASPTSPFSLRLSLRGAVSAVLAAVHLGRRSTTTDNK